MGTKYNLILTFDLDIESMIDIYY